MVLTELVLRHETTHAFFRYLAIIRWADFQFGLKVRLEFSVPNSQFN